MANDGSKFLEILPNGNTARLLMYLIYQGSMDEDSGMPTKVFSAAPEKRHLGRWAGEDISLVGDYAPNDLWRVVDEFWTVMGDWHKCGADVFVSEEAAPPGWESIWHRDVVRKVTDL